MNRWNYQQLKNARDILSLSQEDIANKMGISRQTYNYWESGKVTPRLNSLIKLSNILGLKLSIFFEEK